MVLTSVNAQAAEHIVRIVSDYENLRMMFVPKFLNIEQGDRVTWVNEADEEHNVITFPDGYPSGAEAFQSPIMTRAGERFSHQFEVKGTYEYHCIPHLPMGMHGLIIVGRASKHDEFYEPSPAEVKAYRKLMLEWFDDGEIELPDHEERLSAD
jgi:pseudoazurin